MAFLRVVVLLWADMLAAYVMWIMPTYLTNVWKLGFTRAAGIMNVANGLAKVLPLVFFLIVDCGLGNYWMLLLSSVSYAIGLGFLSMSTPPVLAKETGSCKHYKPECIGHTQKALFYTALALIAVGISGHIVSLVALFVDQFEKKKADVKFEKPRHQSKPFVLHQIRRKRGGATSDGPNYPFPPPKVPNNPNAKKQGDDAEDDMLSQLQFQPVEAMLALVNREKVKVFRACLVILFPVIGLIALPYIRPWSLRFGIPAICTLVATMAFLLGSYNDNKPKGSPVTNVLRVLVASTLKMFHKLPTDSSKLYEKNEHDDKKLSHTEGLRFLDKAAIKEEPVTNKWRVCTVTEVEETKIIVNMLPIWITFIICGVVTSIGSTYFVEQGNHMNFKVGKLKFPNSILLVLYELTKSRSKTMYTFIASHLGAAGLKRYAPPVGIAFATLFSVLCCIVAALVETRRLHVLRDHGLLDKPDEKIPMTVFWLLPQYILLAVLDSFYENSAAPFLSDQSPPSMKKYLVYFNPGLSGLGITGSVLSVFLVGRISERRGKENWFQYTLNKSRLDRYYWVLAVLSAANFFWFLVAALRYPYREPTSNDKQENGNEEGNAMEAVEGVIPNIE
ncbi:protein NRT1/ PTR FAMILY 5.5 [Coffea arabica]|uniref:Protein NRT1/ PTR FAMILY 5.5 n=1 Tax=Coffea arabica TaxID=13443 RepID=A0A6P6VCB4_COFAR|nr:protein NRT1/ PTR FAMILY 5.5-like [Coffea arabica]